MSRDTLSEVRQHVRRVILGESATADTPLSIRDTGYGYWISPKGELIEVPSHGHAKVAGELAKKRGIKGVPDDEYSYEDAYRIPFVKKGWVRVVTGGRELVAQAMRFNREAVEVLVDLVDLYVEDGGKIRIDDLSSGETVEYRGGREGRFKTRLRAMLEDSAEGAGEEKQVVEALDRSILG